MSDTNGRLPKGWESVKITQLCELINGRAFKPTEWTDAGLPIIRIQNLNSPDAKYNHFDGNYNRKHLVQSGDLLFAWSGTPGTSFGAHIWRGDTALLNQHIFRVVTPVDLIDNTYLQFAINHKLDELIQNAQGGVGLRHVTKGKFEKTEILLPPLAEQQRIVAKIEALQERSRLAREALSEVGALVEQFRQSVLAAAFRGDLTADWRAAHPEVEPASELLRRIRAERRRRWEQAELAKYEAKDQKPPQNWKDNYKEPEPVDDSDLPGLPDGWQWVSLDEVAYSMRSGNAKTSLKAPTNWPILQSSAVRQGLIDFGNVNYMAEDESEESENVLSEGDLMVTRLSGSLDYVGVCAIVHGLNGRRIQYPDRLFRVRLCKALVAKYIEFSFRCQPLRAGLEASAKSSAGHQRISLSDLRSLRFPLPPYAEQELIAETLTQVFASALSIADECSAIAEQADLLDQAILAKAFRGELVPQGPSDEPASMLLERIRAQPKRQAKTPKQTSKSHQTNNLGKNSSRLEPQQLMLAEVLRTAD